MENPEILEALKKENPDFVQTLPKDFQTAINEWRRLGDELYESYLHDPEREPE